MGILRKKGGYYEKTSITETTKDVYKRQKQGRVNHEMTVAAHNVPSNMEVEVVQSAVTVQLSGNETLLKNQQELANIVLYVDCSGLDGGTHTLPVQVECYGALHVEQVAPAQVLSLIHI